MKWVLKKMALKKALKASKKVVKKDGVVPSTTAKKTVKTATKTSKKITRTRAKTDGTATPAKKSRTRKPQRPTMTIDFTPGTDMEVAFLEVQKGGASRAEVTKRLAEMWKNHTTRNGNSKPVSTIVNHVVRRARANGFEIEQTWRLVKIDPAKKTNEDTTTEAGTPTRAIKKKPQAIKASKKAVKRRTKV
jgi:hypothetical protein